MMKIHFMEPLELLGVQLYVNHHVLRGMEDYGWAVGGDYASKAFDFMRQLHGAAYLYEKALDKKRKSGASKPTT